MSTKRKGMNASNLVLPAAAMPAGAPAVDPSARERFIASTAPAHPPRTRPPKLAERGERQLLVYLSRPELRIETNVRAAMEDLSVSAWVERLIVEELARPARKPAARK